MSIAVFLQVRLDSSRLPGKALLKIEDMTLIEHAMRSLRRIPADQYLLLTTEDSVEQLSPFAEKWGFIPFTGPKDDVLLRFIRAVRKFKIKTLIRATGDNPLVSGPLAEEVLKEHKLKGADYSNWPGAPLGTGIEVVETKALESALVQSREAYDHEHVTPFIYNNPDKFNLNIHPVPEKYRNDKKVSVDTPEDFENIRNLFSVLYRSEPIELEDLIEYLKKEDYSGKN